MVFFDRVCEGIDTARVVTDDLQSACKATDHLIQHGCKKIAFLSISEGLSITQQRIEGYKQSLATHGMRFNPSDIVPCTHDAEENLRLLGKIFARDDRPDGVIASVEKLAVQVYQACRSQGLSIPGDLKVIGFSNLATASLLYPSMTTVTQPAFEMRGRKPLRCCSGPWAIKALVFRKTFMSFLPSCRSGIPLAKPPVIGQ